ncbi:MAG: SDR family oxidoreductase [Alphaproteobacteria bacterium]
MARYLVTGGAGFIGSHLTEALRARGDDVRVVDDLSTGKRANLAHVAGVEFVQGDLANLDVARAAVQGVDYVLHQAAIPSVPRSVADPLMTNRANVDATLNVLVAARDAGVKRLVFAGSSSVYGSTPGLPKDELMPTAPMSPYALQKLAGETYCRMFHRLYGLETVVTRYFNVFGPRQDPGSPYSGVISLFVTALASGTRPVVHGDGGQTRDFTYVANVVDGVLRAVAAPDAAGEVINLATNHRVSLLDLLQTLATEMGVTATPAFAPARAGDVRDSLADIGKARRLLGYEPVVPFAEGLRRTVAWYRSQLAEA